VSTGLVPISMGTVRRRDLRRGRHVQARALLSGLIIAFRGECSRHQSRLAALDRRVAKRPGQEPKGSFVTLREPSGVDRTLHTPKRRALLDHAFNLLVGSVEGE